MIQFINGTSAEVNVELAKYEPCTVISSTIAFDASRGMHIICLHIDGIPLAEPKEPESTPGPETYRTVVYSTSLLSRYDMSVLDKEVKEPVSCTASRPTGYFVKIRGMIDEVGNTYPPFSQLSPIVRTALMDAHDEGYACVEFDCDV